jgi:hypothetical protein
MEGHAEGVQRLEDIFYVEIWAACDAYMKVWKAKLNEVLDKLKDAFTRGGESRGASRLVQAIDDKICWTLIWQREHFFQAVCQSLITGLSRAAVVSCVKT